MDKKKVIVHINNIPPDVMEALREKYTDGYMNHIRKYTKPNNDFFYAVTVDTADASYLVKVDVKIDNITEDKLDDAIFSNVAGIKPGSKGEEEETESDEEEDEADSKPAKPEGKDDEIF